MKFAHARDAYESKNKDCINKLHKLYEARFEMFDPIFVEVSHISSLGQPTAAAARAQLVEIEKQFIGTMHTALSRLVRARAPGLTS